MGEKDIPLAIGRDTKPPMPDLLKSRPIPRKRLYLNIDDEAVSPDIAEFTWDWIKKATLIKRKVTFVTHLEAGHFGPYEVVSDNNWRFLEGHRAICRFNNGRYENQPVKVLTREQFEDLRAGRPMRDMPVMVGGRIVNKPISLKNYNSEEFVAAKRYTPDQANILAMERVEDDVKNKKVPWYSLPKKGEEYKKLWYQRWRFFNDLYLKEMVIVAREIASQDDISRAADLPASILCLINNKLTVTQAEFYISRWIDFQNIHGDEAMNSPSLSFNIHQVILEELLMEHYRDLQRLYGDNIDKSIQDALKDSTKRHQDLMPAEPNKTKPPAQEEPEEQEEDDDPPPAKESITKTPFRTGRKNEHSPPG